MMQKDQNGWAVEDTYGSDYANSFVVVVDLMNDGNTRVNVQYADIGSQIKGKIGEFRFFGMLEAI